MNICKVSQIVVNKSLKWIELWLKQPRAKGLKKTGSSSEPTSSTNTRQYKRLKKGVAVVEAAMKEPPFIGEPPQSEEEVSLKQIDDALRKSKVTYEVATIRVNSGFGATPLAIVHPREEVSKQGTFVVPPQTKDIIPTIPSTLGAVVVAEERPPVIDVTESHVS